MEMKKEVTDLNHNYGIAKEVLRRGYTALLRQKIEDVIKKMDDFGDKHRVVWIAGYEPQMQWNGEDDMMRRSSTKNLGRYHLVSGDPTNNYVLFQDVAGRNGYGSYNRDRIMVGFKAEGDKGKEFVEAMQERVNKGEVYLDFGLHAEGFYVYENNVQLLFSAEITKQGNTRRYDLCKIKQAFVDEPSAEETLNRLIDKLTWEAVNKNS